MIRTQINLTDSQYRYLQNEAKKRSRSLSAIIRDAIDKKLTKGKEGNAWVLLAMAKKAGRSGQKNLARDYKRFLWGDKSKFAKH